MLLYWDDIRCKNIVNEFIWNNENITIANKMLFNSKLFMNGAWYVSDLFETNMLTSFKVWLSNNNNSNNNEKIM